MKKLFEKGGIFIVSILNRILIMPLWLFEMKWVYKFYEYIVILVVVITDYILLRKQFRSNDIIGKILYVVGLIVLNYLLSFILSFLLPGDYGLEVIYDTEIITIALVVLMFITCVSDIIAKTKIKK